MTDGSLRTIPRPFMYTSVLAVPRSMARSRAIGSLFLVGLRRRVARFVVELLHLVDHRASGLGRQGVNVTLERLHTVGVAATGEGDQRQTDHDDDRAEDDPDHDAEPTRSLMGCAAVPQSEPSAHVSCFQIGAEALSSSIAKRAASNAWSRWGADTTATTAHSPTASAPVRWSRATRPTAGHRSRTTQ